MSTRFNSDTLRAAEFQKMIYLKRTAQGQHDMFQLAKVGDRPQKVVPRSRNCSAKHCHPLDDNAWENNKEIAHCA